jgi:anti-anti-sigma regulatory factor
VRAVDELCRLVMVARRLGCGVHLTGVDPELRSLFELAGVAEMMCECTPAVGAVRPPTEFG